MAKSPRQEADGSTDSDEKKFVCADCGEEFDSAKSRGMHRRWNHDNPWESEEKLRTEYISNQKSIPEIADEWDCGETTIEQWLDKHNINTRDRGGHPDSAPWKDKQTLKSLYHEKGLSMLEIADKFDVAYSTINSHMKQNDIDVKDRHKPFHDKEWLLEHYRDKEFTAKEIGDMFDTHESTIFHHLRRYNIPRDYRQRTEIEGRTLPYMTIYHRECNKNHTMLVHRLVAYAHGIIDDIFDSEKMIHHKNGVKWINSPENLQCVTNKEHREIHIEGDIESDFIQSH